MLGDEFGLLGRRGVRFEEPLHHRGAWIDFEIYALRHISPVLVHGLHHATHVGGHKFIGINCQSRRIHQAITGLNFSDSFAERCFHPSGERFGIIGAEGTIRLREIG